MTITLTVPAALEEIVQRFDARAEPFTEFDIGAELNAARRALIDPSEPDNLGAWAEVLAFGLATGRHENPWNSYFGPMGSGTDGEGKTVYFPEIAGTPAVAVDHWVARARSLKHPFLKARYADLAWEMSGLTRILMQQKIGAAGENLKSFEHKIEISKDDMEKFLDLVVVDDLVTSFVRVTREFLLKRAELEQQVQKTLKEAPLMAHITQMIMADDHVAAKIGSVGEDPFGRLFHQAKIAFQFVTPWLAQALRRLSEKHEIVPEHFAGWANRHGLFDDMSLLVEGIHAWERNDQVKAAHVLIPQIERALRKIADGLGVPVTKAHPKVSGTSIAIGMGEILYNDKVAEALGPDATLHFQALYADPRGMNLRNEIAHGLIDVNQFYWHLGNLIVHSLLILGLWKEFGQKRKN
jgi:hypothetical protein